MPNATRTLPRAVIDAWKSGRKIEAIGLLRSLTGLGLAEAKAVMEALEAAGKDAPPAAGSGSIASPTSSNVRLKFERKFSIGKRPAAPAARDPKLSPGEVPRTSGMTGALVLALVAAAVLVYYLLR